jgi:crotonobetainyl-CoA:carnitine CoA-transferase CaiB-like acyl-CoA transferase
MSSHPLRVVDFSSHVSGPMASHLLVTVGAQVIKVENPRVGDGNRGIEPLIHGEGDMHVGLNPGTRSLAVSTHSPHWNDVVSACVRWADGVIVGARPVDAERRGLDFAALLKVDPQLVYCLITGYGLQGPFAEYTAHGQNIDALAGNVEVEWVDGAPVTRPGWRSAGTTLAGVFGALGLLAGVIRRDRGEGPQFVHTSIWNAAIWWNWRDVNTLANTGRRWTDYADRGSRYAMYATSDRGVLLLCPIERRFWEVFVDLVELPNEWRAKGDWTHGMHFGDEEERPIIAEKIRQRSREQWTKLLERSGIPFAPVLTLEEVIENEHALRNGVLQHTMVKGLPTRLATSPVQLYPDAYTALTQRPQDLCSPPDIGEHTAEILAEIGLIGLDPDDLSAP